MKLSFREADVDGKRVLVREDLNVPVAAGQVQDDTRVRAAAPTLRELAGRGARVIVLSHLGRPRGRQEDLSLRPVAPVLERALGQPVGFAPDCIGEPARAAVSALAPGAVLLLENLRFHPGEEADADGFARQLAELGDVYVNDAFAVSHRAHASVVAITRFLPAYAGQLMLDELEALHRALDEPLRPLIAVVGGAKVSTKAGVLRFLLPKVDRLLVGGAMANTFVKAEGLDVGRSLVEDSALAEAAEVARLGGPKLMLPTDAVAAARPAAGVTTRVVPIGEPLGEDMLLDIGPGTAADFAALVADAGTVVWNGPLGVAEIAEFSIGTRTVGEAIAHSRGYTLVGGGDTAAAVQALGLHGFSHVSTGGGATLEYMEGRQLPGVAALQEAPARVE